MRDIDKDVLVEFSVLKNLKKANVINQGWDNEFNSLSGSRDLDGMVFSSRDLDHLKHSLKVDNFGSGYGVLFGLRKLSSSEWHVYGFEYVAGSTETLYLRDYNLDPSTGDYSSTNIKTWSFASSVFSWGMNLELKDSTVYLYDDSYTKRAEYTFTSGEWDENIAGIVGNSTTIHTFVAYQLMKFGESARYDDYKLDWDRNEGWSGNIFVYQRDNIYWKAGSFVNVYLKPFRKSGLGDDYHGDLSRAFCGYIDDIGEQGISKKEWDVEVVGEKARLSGEETLMVLDSLNPQSQSITRRNGSSILTDIYNREYDVNNLSFSGDAFNSYLLSIDGTLREAERYILYEEKQTAIIERVEGGALVDITVYNDQSGINLSVEVEGTEEDDIIEGTDLEKKTGGGHYLNRIYSQAKLDDKDVERWICRANRFDRFIDKDTIIDEEKSEKLRGGVSSLSSLASRIESEIDSMYSYWSGEITLQGNHHYLGGLSKQGTLTVTYPEKNLDGDNFAVKSLELTPTQTTIGISKAPRLDDLNRIEKLRRSLVVENREDIFSALEELKAVDFKDSKTPLWSDTSDILQIDVEDADNVKMIKDIDYHTTKFRGYRWIDLKLLSEDLLREDVSPSLNIDQNFENQLTGEPPEDWVVNFGDVSVVEKAISSSGMQSLKIPYQTTSVDFKQAQLYFHFLDNMTFDELSYYFERGDDHSGDNPRIYFHVQNEGNLLIGIQNDEDSSKNLLWKPASRDSVTEKQAGTPGDQIYVRFYNIDWSAYTYDIEIKVNGSSAATWSSVSFLHNMSYAKEIEVSSQIDADTCWFDDIATSGGTVYLSGMGLPKTAYNKIDHLRIRTSNSDPNDYTVALNNFLKTGLYLVPSYYRIVNYSPAQNQFTIAGDITTFLSRVSEVDVYGAGQGDGTYTVRNYGTDSDGNTWIEVESNLTDDVRKGYVDSENRTNIDLVFAIQEKADTIGWSFNM